MFDKDTFNSLAAEAIDVYLPRLRKAKSVVLNLGISGIDELKASIFHHALAKYDAYPTGTNYNFLNSSSFPAQILAQRGLGRNVNIPGARIGLQGRIRSLSHSFSQLADSPLLMKGNIDDDFI